MNEQRARYYAVALDVVMVDTDGQSSVVDHAPTPQGAEKKAAQWQKREDRAVAKGRGQPA